MNSIDYVSYIRNKISLCTSVGFRRQNPIFCSPLYTQELMLYWTHCRASIYICWMNPCVIHRILLILLLDCCRRRRVTMLDLLSHVVCAPATGRLIAQLSAAALWPWRPPKARVLHCPSWTTSSFLMFSLLSLPLHSLQINFLSSVL